MGPVEEAFAKIAPARQVYGLAMAFKPVEVVEPAAEKLDAAIVDVALAVLDAAEAGLNETLVSEKCEVTDVRHDDLRARIEALREA